MNYQQFLQLYQEWGPVGMLFLTILWMKGFLSPEKEKPMPDTKRAKEDWEPYSGHPSRVREVYVFMVPLMDSQTIRVARGKSKNPG